ncbi:DUF945 family protein [Orbus sturtevantii]|uniref:DUF945 family protein n=1 Tax=Orbus sturtevantii TaxID=3074109 RepID=UPI00370D834B
MKFIEILKPKKIALYTALIVGSSFFIVACDNAKTPNSIEKPAEMSQQQLSDFIKTSISNFIIKYNQAQSFATISLESFMPSTDDQQITMVLRAAIVNLSDNTEQPIIIDLTYLITPEQSLQNDVYTVAKFTSQKMSFNNNSSDADDSFTLFAQKLISDAGLTENGYIIASGDILSEIKSKNGFDYVNEDGSDELTAFNIAPSSYHFQTKENMSLVDVNYNLPSLTFEFDDANVSIKNISTQQLDHSFDDKFSYTGQNLYKIDSVNINNENDNIVLKNIIIETKSNITDNGFANQYVSSSLSGTFPNAAGKLVDFSSSGNLKVENLNLEAAQKWNQYFSNPAFAYMHDDAEKLELLSDLFKDGFSFAISDTNIELDGDRGTVDFSLDIAPMNISKTAKPSTVFMQVFNNITIQVNSELPVQWFNALGAGMSQDELDKMIKQSVQQIDMMGYEGALAYDGKKLTAHFEIKKGNVFVNGELKGSLINTLAPFMQ